MYDCLFFICAQDIPLEVCAVRGDRLVHQGKTEQGQLNKTIEQELLLPTIVTQLIKVNSKLMKALHSF